MSFVPPAAGETPPEDEFGRGWFHQFYGLSNAQVAAVNASRIVEIIDETGNLLSGGELVDNTISIGIGSDVQGDPDNDGINNFYEFLSGNDPNRADTDSDGINDGDEDEDNDGLTNIQEMELSTHPLSDDTDGDSDADNAEWLAGTDGAAATDPAVDGVLELDGTGDFVSLPQASRFAFDGGWTIEAWVNPQDAFAGEDIIISRNVGPENYTLGITAAGLPFVRFTDVDEVTSLQVTSVDDFVPLDIWTHLAAVFNPVDESLRLYVNGAEEAAAITLNTSATNGPGPVSTTIGAGFDGWIDEVRIWATARSKASINSQRTVILATAGGLASYLRFDHQVITRNGVEYAVDYNWFQDWRADYRHAAILEGDATIVVPDTELPVRITDDNDGDLMADVWEIAHFGNLDSNGQIDSDGDRLNDLYEYFSNTNPLVADTDAATDTDGRNDF